MGQKTRAASAAAIVAGAVLTFFGTEGSYAGAANAQASQEIEQLAQAPDPKLTEETVPVFVSEEMVQEAPEEPEPASAPQAGSLKELIAKIDTTDTLSDEMQCLAGAVYFESRGEPISGQLAVAQVVINRVESRQFPSSYCGVVYQRSQFSFVKGGRMPRIKTGSAAWKRAKAIAKIAHEGLWESEAGDALYFHAKYVRPAWANRKVARATIDTHIFYR